MARSLPNAPPGRVTAVVIAGLIGLATSILGPIIVRWFTDRVAVQLQLVAQSSLVDGTSELTKLQVTYDKRVVSSLSRIELNLFNSGRKAIRSEDIVAPIIVSIDSGRILDVRTEQRLPPPHQNRFELDTSRQYVTIHTPVLNPGDGARFTLLVDRIPPPRVIASARIVGLRAVNLIDRRPKVRSIWTALPWTVYLVSIGVAVALLGLILFSYLGGYTHRARYVWRFRSAFLSHSSTPEQYGNALELSFGTDARLAANVNPILDRLPPRTPIPLERFEVLNRAVEKHIRDARVSGYWIMITLLVLFMIGATYTVFAVVAAARGLGI